MVKLFLIKKNKILFSEKFNTESITIESLSTIIRNNFIGSSSYPVGEVRRDEIDEAQIIYSYLKNSHSHYLEIPEEWLQASGEASLYEAVNKLLYNFRKSPGSS